MCALPIYLLLDLEKEIQAPRNEEIIPVKTAFEKSVEQAEKLNTELDFQQMKKNYLNSSNALEIATNEVLYMFEDIKEKIYVLQGKKMNITYEENIYEPYFKLNSEGFSFSLSWNKKYGNSLEGAVLNVKKRKEKLTDYSKNVLYAVAPSDVIDETNYNFDLDRNSNKCWLNLSNKKIYYSTQIVDNYLSWLVMIVTNKKLNT